MKTEDDLRDDMARGNRAQAILEDPMFKSAIRDIQETIYSDFAATNLDDDLGRLKARIKIDVLEDILTNISDIMETGYISAQELAELKRREDAQAA